MSNNASYDRALLDDAPAATPQQRQRFYDADLLNEDTSRDRARTTSDAAPLPAGAAPVAMRSNTDIEAAHPSRSKEYAPLPPPATRKTPWFRTRGGIIALVVVALVVIAAVVGGAVGGTQAHKNSSKSSNASSNGTSSSESVLPPSISPTSSQSQAVGSGSATSTEGAGTAGQAPVSTSSPAATSSLPASSSSASQQQQGVGTAAALVASLL